MAMPDLFCLALYQLVTGHAEIFGAEMADGKTYLFGQECKAAVFTWQGCTIEMSLPLSYRYGMCVLTRIFAFQHVTGHPSVEYLSDETPMVAYANVHMALEVMRVRALAAVHGSPLLDDGDDDMSGTDAPRVLVLGPENSGKTSVCKILTNYAVRTGQDWTPVLVNVDPSEVSLYCKIYLLVVDARSCRA